MSRLSDGHPSDGMPRRFELVALVFFFAACLVSLLPRTRPAMPAACRSGSRCRPANGGEEGWLHVRNKAGLGWKAKTRNERDVPLIPALTEMLRIVMRNHRNGPVFRQRVTLP